MPVMFLRLTFSSRWKRTNYKDHVDKVNYLQKDKRNDSLLWCKSEKNELI